MASSREADRAGKDKDINKEGEISHGQETSRGSREAATSVVVGAGPLIRSVSEGTRACDFNFDLGSSRFTNLLLFYNGYDISCVSCVVYDVYCDSGKIRPFTPLSYLF